MVGIFVFPVKPNNKDYKFYKEPRKVLEIDDETVLTLTGASTGIYYMIRHDKEWEKLSDAEVVEKWNERRSPIQIQLAGRKSGLGYSTVNKDVFVRIVRKNAK